MGPGVQRDSVGFPAPGRHGSRRKVTYLALGPGWTGECIRVKCLQRRCV